MLISAPQLSFPLEAVTLYHTTEPAWSDAPVLVFLGPSASNNGTQTSWRIQAHVLTPAGFQSHPRITTSPNSPLYVAVNHLPADQQGDEIRRGLAISLLKYLSEVPDEVRKVLKNNREHGQMQRMFDETHAASLAGRMVKVENASEVFADLQAALDGRCVSNMDAHLVVPEVPLPNKAEIESRGLSVDELRERRFGKYASLVNLLGTPTFLPTSRLQRAPSRPMAHSHNKSLSAEQDELIKREMVELAETEERYVSKLKELVTDTAEALRIGLSNADRVTLQALFPRSLEEILNVNSQFLASMRQSLDAPQTSSMQAADFQRPPNAAGTDDIVEWSKVLLHWIPKFADCYSSYIRASGGFPQVLSRILRDSESTLSRRIRELGEQRLRATLIEPVQRLPRYSLFIDNVTNLLPSKHAALQPLLQARDMVANICSLQSPGSEKPQTIDRLRGIVASWPANFRPDGRLISAADYTELLPPYRQDRASVSQGGRIFLLFSGYLVRVRKNPGSSLTARGVIAEVDRPSKESLAASVTAASMGKSIELPLTFEGFHLLKDIRFSESSDASLLFVAPADNAAQQKVYSQVRAWSDKADTCTRVFYLLGAHEGRVGRWTEEITKARIAGRYSEEQRESDSWELRSLTVTEQSFTMFTAVTQDVADNMTRAKSPAAVHIVVDGTKRHGLSATHPGTGLNMSITLLEYGSYQLETRYCDGRTTVDEVNVTGLAGLLIEKVGDLLRRQHQPSTHTTANCHVADNLRLLQAMSFRTEGDDLKQRAFRPPSPVKLFSNFLSGAMSKDPPSPSKQPFPGIGDIPALHFPTPKLTRSESHRGKADLTLDSSPGVIALSSTSTDALCNPFSQLEETLAAYAKAIQAQAGNIPGDLLRSRWESDELHINELYNALLETPSRYGEAPTDVLFAAFEKFLKRAWYERLGPVISSTTLNSIQDKSGLLSVSAFETYFKATVADMTPQNRRAFTKMIKLLADLLDASGSDGDRGALTVTFAEMLVSDGNPQSCISLLDRLVEDFETLFDDRSSEGATTSSTPMTGSMSSAKRARSTNTGSLSSNASSLRKRFALSRENSKLDADSKIGSVWRTLSKTARGAVTGEASVSKISLSRSKSTDVDGRMLPPARPVSQDGSYMLGTLPFEESSRPQSSRLPGTPTAGGGPVELVRTQLPRKKRRSSLSDLASLQNSPAASTYSPLPRRVPDSAHNTPPRTPSPVKGAPPRSQLGQFPANLKENSPMSVRGTLVERATNIQTEEASQTGQKSPKKANAPVSSIPTLKGSARGKPSVTLPDTPTRKTSTSPQKVRVQSPQKLRQRLLNEQDAIGVVDQGLQAELEKIGEDLALLGRAPSVRSKTAALRPTTTTSTNTSTGRPTSSESSTSSAVRALTERLSALEKKHGTILGDLNARTSSINRDVDATVLALHNKVKKLEELYREANAENELLYERFNQELAALSRGGGAGGGGGGSDNSHAGTSANTNDAASRSPSEKVAITKLREVQEELAKVKKENAKLQRENLALKASVLGGGAVGTASKAEKGEIKAS